MRLLSTRSLQLEEFINEFGTNYAILSHTWGKEEITFPDMADLDKARRKTGFAKIQGACALAASQGHDYIWIDTCCIDKSSSAELSEAINSMYRWYGSSKVCYAYLSDVEDPAHMGGSRWFTRGWTLQELIAPGNVEFYTSSWAYIGQKQDSNLLPTISQASLVDECVLAGVVHLRHVSVARRMYWASARKTTRKEDEAYCLMGLFMVNMPLLYGEGARAFIRLQREITSITDDQSILAWYCNPYPGRSAGAYWISCCAPSPRCFAMSGNISPVRKVNLADRPRHIDFTGTMARFSVIVGDVKPGGLLEAILYCQVGPVPGTYPTLILRRQSPNSRYCMRFVQDGVVSQLSLYTPRLLLGHPGIPTNAVQAKNMSNTNPLALFIMDRAAQKLGGSISPKFAVESK
jgi:hypothetical protein